MSRPLEKIVLFVIAVFFTAIVFLLDLYSGHLYHLSILYILIITYTWLLPGKYSVAIASVICTSLTFYVAILQFSDTQEAQSIFNAALTSVAIWVAMFLTLISRRGYQDLKITIEGLDKTVKNRTASLRLKLIDSEVKNRVIEKKNKDILALNTELKLKTDRVNKSRIRFRNLMHEAPTGIAIINSEGVIIEANRFIKARLKNGNKIVDQQMINFIEKEDQLHFQALLQSFLLSPAKPEIFSVELRFASSDSYTFPAEVSLAQLDFNQTDEIILNLFDLSERKAKEEINLRATAMEIKKQEIEHMAYLASHDLQEPLRSIIGLVNLLEDKLDLDEESQEFIDYIKGASQRMGDLIRYLLNYGKLGTTEKEKDVDMEKIMADVLADVQFTIKKTGAEITVQKMPPVKVGSSFELRILMQNLVSNALKFSPKGETPRINIGFTQNEKGSFYFVADQGIGIDKEDYEIIFNMFQRLHNRTEYEGTGIGLAFGKKIVEAHNGQMFLESEKGKGTTFYFSLNENKHSSFITLDAEKANFNS